MAYLSEETIDPTAAIGFTASHLRNGARRALVGVRGGNVSVRRSGSNPGASTYYFLGDGAWVDMEESLDLVRFLTASGTPVIYVTYFDQPSIRGNFQ